MGPWYSDLHQSQIPATAVAAMTQIHRNPSREICALPILHRGPMPEAPRSRAYEEAGSSRDFVVDDFRQRVARYITMVGG